MPYHQGLSRGDTPPADIPTHGAGGKRNPSTRRVVEENAPCPFMRDEELIFPQRHEGMNLGVIIPEDVPPGPERFTKDFSLSLMTSDIERAQPVLAHPTAGTGLSMPWKCLDMPDKEQIARSTAKTHYPFINNNRPRDLSLTTADIDQAQPKGIGVNCEGRARTDCAVNPLFPVYAHPSSEAQPPPSPRWTRGRCTLNTTDVELAMPKHVPNLPSSTALRTDFGDTMKCEDAFRSKGRNRAIQDVLKRTLAAEDSASPTAWGSSHRGDLTQRAECPKRNVRQTCPLEPRYTVALPSKAATSIHVQWTEERVTGHVPPATYSGEVGRIDGSAPRTKHRDNGEPHLSLVCRDIQGATPITKIGSLPYSIYGPQGKRPQKSTCLDLTDIQGTDAGSLRRGSARGSVMSARGSVIVGTVAGAA